MESLASLSQPWTREDDQLLALRIQKKGLNWQKIAEVFSERHTLEECKQRAVVLLNVTAHIQDIRFGNKKPHYKTKRVRREVIRYLPDIETCTQNWTKVTSTLPHQVDVRRAFIIEYLHGNKGYVLPLRYERDWQGIVTLLGLDLSPEACKEHYKTPKEWLPREDFLLRDAILHPAEWGKPNWKEVAVRAFKGHVLRKGNACRDRFQEWMNKVQESGPWSTSEDNLLQWAITEHGENWPLIALQYFPGRRRAKSCSNRNSALQYHHVTLKPIDWEAIGALLKMSPEECKAHFTNLQGWLPQEDELLKETILSSEFKEGIFWSEIALKMYSGFLLRRSYDCRARFQEWMDRLQEQEAWSPDEDLILQQAVSKHGVNWPLIVLNYFPETRTSLSAYIRFSRLNYISSEPINWDTVSIILQLPPKECEKHFINRKSWLPQEDELLKHAILCSEAHKEGIRWAEIASQMYAGIRLRIAYECRERFLELMDRIDENGPWTSHEDKTLQAAISQYGVNWPLIALLKFPSTRTANSCSKRNTQLQTNEKRAQANEAESEYSDSSETPAAARKRSKQDDSEEEWVESDEESPSE